ncbi:hypothetical protein DCC39_18540 [Pueribacillus theae]|uniref:Plastocyanin-like domain-containing protein n=1 Tax=Pueribacillus theae TaxID=2171751 RepID=A0A2U1JI45_9BACI|nr:hypothetical protein DCC39_18540 [Pueribacillus theae]
MHWHGVDVPNGEDGVAGMTQDAVMPGESYIYRFVVKEAGTHWYHSHQQSSIQVQKGLFGAHARHFRYAGNANGRQTTRNSV